MCTGVAGGESLYCKQMTRNRIHVVSSLPEIRSVKEGRELYAGGGGEGAMTHAQDENHNENTPQKMRMRRVKCNAPQRLHQGEKKQGNCVSPLSFTSLHMYKHTLKRAQCIPPHQFAGLILTFPAAMGFL